MNVGKGTKKCWYWMESMQETFYDKKKDEYQVYSEMGTFL